MGQNGVIFITSGEPYTLAACEAARSIRATSPGLAIDLFTAEQEVPVALFDQVHKIENPHRRAKLDYLYQTRFARTLYLDADTRVVADISEMFQVLDRFDIALAHAHARNREAVRAVWRTAIPDSFPQFNAGVILYRSTPRVVNLLKDWQASYRSAGFRKDQVVLRELLWVSDLRICVLPPEYNVRYKKYLSLWDKKEAIPRILHFRDFHPDAGSRGTPDNSDE
jgi:hypothetical protein